LLRANEVIEQGTALLQLLAAGPVQVFSRR